MKSSKTPDPTPEQLAAEAMQREQSAQLDAQENQRRKRLLGAAQGVRAFRGSALFRTAPRNASAGAAPAAAPIVDTRSSLLPDYQG